MMGRREPEQRRAAAGKIVKRRALHAFSFAQWLVAQREARLGTVPAAALRTVALVVKKQSFAVKPSAVADKRPVRPYDTVARDDDRNRVAAVGQSDRPAGAAAADLPGELRVAPGFPVRDLAQRSPDPALELGTGKVQVHVELRELTGEVGGQLVGDVPKGAASSAQPVRSVGAWAWPAI